MVWKVSIENFKSIKQLRFDAKRVNVFIGEPNTGKSDLLEALGVFSSVYEQDLLIRYKDPSDLFYNNLLSEDIKVQADNYTYNIPVNHFPLHLLAEMKKDGKALGFLEYNFKTEKFNVSANPVERIFKYFIAVHK